jgi:predicted permease
MATLWIELRYGMRTLRRHPWFTAVAVLSLALGIGANTAIFSVVDAVLLRSLPFRDVERLAIVWEEASFAGFPQNTPAPANYLDWKAQNSVFEDMAAIADRSFTVTGGGEPEKVMAQAVTANLFQVLGVRPLLGRDFLPDDDTPDSNVVLISYGLWQRRFGGEPGVIDRDIMLDGQNHRVVGVMPRAFQFLGDSIGIWKPLGLTPQEAAKRTNHYLSVVARLKPGVTMQRAQLDMETIMSRLAREYPNEVGKLGAVVVPLRDQLAGGLRRPLLALQLAVGLVLLISCGNVASLLLSRSATRRREIAMRTTLGASRSRIVRQLIMESLLLAIAGGAFGVLLAWSSFTFLQRLIPPAMSLSTGLEIDATVLAFTAVICVLSALGFSLAPALQASRADLSEAMKQGAPSGGPASQRRLRDATVVGQVALAFVVLVGAALLVRTVYALQNQYSGLRPDRVVRTELSPAKYGEPSRRASFYEEVLARVASLPGVVSAGYTTSVPLEWKGGTSGFFPEGKPSVPGLVYDANHRQVSADYLPTIGIPLLQGRNFDERDDERAQPVAIVNETMARQYWPGEDAVGKRFKVGTPDSEWRVIVGVAGDVRQMGVDAPVKAEMYLPYPQMTTDPWYAARDLVIRLSGDPLEIANAVRQEVRAVDPDQPISEIETMAAVIGRETAAQRVSTVLSGAFGTLALLLATVGLYGVLSYFVAQHTRQIGVRLALGAQQSQVLSLVLKKGLLLTALGVGVGLGASLVLTRLMQSMLFEVDSSDPLTFAGVAALLAGVALAACYLPARRAAGVDPLMALRHD